MSDYNERLVLRAIRAKSPMLNFGFIMYDIFMSLYVAYVVILFLMHEFTIGEAVESLLMVQAWLVFILIAEIPIILGRLDLNNDNLVHFKGTLLVDNNYDISTYSRGLGVAWEIKIDGRKQTVYQHYGVVSDEFTRLEEVEGVYLKHSRVILDMKKLHKY